MPMTDLPRPVPGSYWVVPGQLLAGQYPGSTRGEKAFTHERLTAFLNAGFDTFFDLTRAGELPPYLPILTEDAAHYGRAIRYRHFSVQDKGLTTPEQMKNILDALDAALAEGRKVYLHCQAGIGRTGTVVGCYLVRHGLKGTHAIHRLNELYRTAAQSAIFPSSPETEEQVAFILNWTENGLA
jgi:hypothetical protein